MIIQEGKRIQQWESMTPEDYRTAGESFDLMDFRYVEPAEKEEDDDAEYQERAERLLRPIEKKAELSSGRCKCYALTNHPKPIQLTILLSQSILG